MASPTPFTNTSSSATSSPATTFRSFDDCNATNFTYSNFTDSNFTDSIFINSNFINSTFTNSTSNNSTITNGNCTEYSKASAVGIGVGSAVGGALLALLLGLVYTKARGRSHPFRRQRTVSDLVTLKGQSRSNETTVTFPAALARLWDALPQPITHAQLARDASELEVAIKNYLDNYIDWTGAQKSRHMDNNRLSELAGGLRTDWNENLLSSGTRSVTLRTFIARFLAARVNVVGSIESTLLPPEVLETYKAVVEGHEKSREYHSVALQVFSQPLFPWVRKCPH
jgi:hypothetical protein